MTVSYVYVLTALLPLTASILVTQANPYHALVLRGILGAVAALVYTVLGAADVALTEALVGTMLAITLYAVAVRSSLVMRLGVLKEAIPDWRAASKSDDALVALHQADQANSEQPSFAPLLSDLRTVCSKHHLRLELVSYPDSQALQQALVDKEIHASLRVEHKDRYFPESSFEPNSEARVLSSTSRVKFYQAGILSQATPIPMLELAKTMIFPLAIASIMFLKIALTCGQLTDFKRVV
nr:DUF4040 domain-containing protein [Leptolyngbya sp. 7M]